MRDIVFLGGIRIQNNAIFVTAENICSLFLTKGMDREKFELLTLFEPIFPLDGDALVSDGEKIIGLEM